MGILDVRILMLDGTQIDMEMQVAYFQYRDARILFYLSRMFAEQLQQGDSYEKLPEKLQNEESIIRWMRFFGGKSRKELKDMAKTSPFFEEAYKELKKLSADERAKPEYEAREKAIRDYNSQMNSALKRGRKQGIESVIRQMLNDNVGTENIVRWTGASPNDIQHAFL